MSADYSSLRQDDTAALNGLQACPPLPDFTFSGSDWSNFDSLGGNGASSNLPQGFENTFFGLESAGVSGTDPLLQSL